MREHLQPAYLFHPDIEDDEVDRVCRSVLKESCRFIESRLKPAIARLPSAPKCRHQPDRSELMLEVASASYCYGTAAYERGSLLPIRPWSYLLAASARRAF